MAFPSQPKGPGPRWKETASEAMEAKAALLEKIKGYEVTEELSNSAWLLGGEGESALLATELVLDKENKALKPPGSSIGLHILFAYYIFRYWIYI